MWERGNYAEKVQLQKLLSPEEILYNKEKSSYRTEKANLTFGLKWQQNQLIQMKKKKDKLVKTPICPLQ